MTVVSPLIRLYGYLMDSKPATDRVLKVYSKAHHETYEVAMTAATILKQHGRIVPRAALRHGQYVIVSCMRRADGTLQAVRVSIVIRHRHHRTQTAP